MKTTVGTPTTESTAMMASAVTMVLEVTAAMIMVMSARFPNQAPQVSQAPTGGRLVSIYQADRLALGAINSSFLMTSFMNKISLLISILIHPCFLPVGMSTSNRIIKPGYESY
jgi:hypothetical protein